MRLPTSTIRNYIVALAVLAAGIVSTAAPPAAHAGPGQPTITVQSQYPFSVLNISGSGFGAAFGHGDTVQVYVRDYSTHQLMTSASTTATPLMLCQVGAPCTPAGRISVSLTIPGSYIHCGYRTVRVY